MIPIAPLSLAVTIAVLLAATARGEGMKTQIVLWNSGTCPYAQRAWIALAEKGVSFEHKIVDLKNKPAVFLEKYAAAVHGDTSIRAKVPLLEYGDTLVVESLDVIKFIGKTIGEDDTMYPVTDSDALNQVDRFISAFDDVMQSYYQCLAAQSEPDANAGQRTLCESLYNLESRIKGPFCLGEMFSVAECYAAPWVHRISVTMPYFRGVPMNALIRPDSKVAAWMDAVLCRPSVKATSGPEGDLLQSTKNYFVKYVTPGAPGDVKE